MEEEMFLGVPLNWRLNNSNILRKLDKLLES